MNVAILKWYVQSSFQHAWEPINSGPISQPDYIKFVIFNPLPQAGIHKIRGVQSSPFVFFKKQLISISNSIRLWYSISRYNTRRLPCPFWHFQEKENHAHPTFSLSPYSCNASTNLGSSYLPTSTSFFK